MNMGPELILLIITLGCRGLASPRKTLLTLMPSKPLVQLGKSIHLNCSMDCSNGTVRWKGLDTNLGSVFSNSQYSILSISKAAVSHEGTKICTGQCQDRSTQSFVHLQVYSFPEVDLVFKSGDINLLQRPLFICAVRRVYPPSAMTLSWYQGDEKLQMTELNEIELEDELYSYETYLELPSGEPVEGMVYRCEAKLSLGQTVLYQNTTLTFRREAGYEYNSTTEPDITEGNFETAERNATAESVTAAWNPAIESVTAAWNSTVNTAAENPTTEPPTNEGNPTVESITEEDNPTSKSITAESVTEGNSTAVTVPNEGNSTTMTKSVIEEKNPTAEFFTTESNLTMVSIPTKVIPQDTELIVIWTIGSVIGLIFAVTFLQLWRQLGPMGKKKQSFENRTAFHNNVSMAYECLSVGMKKKRPGLNGRTYSEVLRRICREGEAPEEIISLLLKKIQCRDHEAVPYDVFRYGTLTCFVLLEFISKADTLYHVLDDSGHADKRVCQAVLDTLGEAVMTSDLYVPASYLEAGSKLGPDCLALAMDKALLARRPSSSMSRREFLSEAVVLFLTKVKPIN